MKIHISRFLFHSILLFLLMSLASTNVWGTDFIRVDKTRFVRGGKPYYFCGANFWY